MTDGTKCVICQRREHHQGRTVCDTCLGRVNDDLYRIAELTMLASAWLAPRGGKGGSGRSVPDSRPPVDIAALDAAIGNDVLPMLEEWCRTIREHNGLTRYGLATEGRTVTVAGTVAFLRSWLLWAAETPEWPIEELARETRDARWQLERLDPDHDRPDGIRVACTAVHPDHDGRECGNRLVIDGTMLAQDVECRRCGNVTTGGRMILSALNDPAVTVWAYPDVIEATLGIKAATLRQWYARGLIKRNGSRYDVGEAFRRRHYMAGTA